jgi:hypothetical protein
MEKLYCWRCEKEVPMMNAHEFDHAKVLYRRAMFSGKQAGKPKGNINFHPLIEYYHHISGVYESNPNIIIHHRREDFGPVCLDCGKPFRKPDSDCCAECGSTRKQFSIKSFS